MKFNISTQYTIPGTADPIKAYEDHCIRDSTCVRNNYKRLGNEATVVSETIQGNVLEREMLVKPRPETVPLMLKALIGSKGLNFREKLQYDFAKHSGTIKTTMTKPSLAKKVNCSVGVSIRNAGAPSARTVSHDLNFGIDVSMWPISRKVEKALKSQLEERTTRMQQMTQESLNQNIPAAAPAFTASSDDLGQVAV